MWITLFFPVGVAEPGFLGMVARAGLAELIFGDSIMLPDGVFLPEMVFSLVELVSIVFWRRELCELDCEELLLPGPPRVLLLVADWLRVTLFGD